MFTILKKEKAARLGKFETVHGTINTPWFYERSYFRRD